MSSEQSGFQVCIRCKPGDLENVAFTTTDDNTLVSTTQPERTYRFDKVFSGLATQLEVFDFCVKPLVDDLLLGFNGTIFAYGQTGSGKTHTMCGDISTELTSMSGAIPQALHYLFSILKDSMETEYSVEMRYIEVYNEELRDLFNYQTGLDTATSKPQGRGNLRGGTQPLLRPKTSPGQLRIVDDQLTKTSEVIGAHSRYVSCFEGAMEVFDMANSRRTTAATLLNSDSSRSHSILTISFISKIPGEENSGFRSKLNFVDLAGSESIAKSGAVDMRAKEAGEINKSLLSLGRVIETLVENENSANAPSHVPYRDSKLTRILQDSLGGPCKTRMIATVALGEQSQDASKNTLEYATKARSIRNKEQVNRELMDFNPCLSSLVRKLENYQFSLDSQLSQHKGIRVSQREYQEYCKAKRENKSLKADLRADSHRKAVELDLANKQKLAYAEENAKLRKQIAEQNSEISSLKSEQLNSNQVTAAQVNEKLDSLIELFSDCRRGIESHATLIEATSSSAFSSIEEFLSTLLSQNNGLLQDSGQSALSTINNLIDRTRKTLEEDMKSVYDEHSNQVAAAINSEIQSKFDNLQEYVGALETAVNERQLKVQKANDAHQEELRNLHTLQRNNLKAFNEEVKRLERLGSEFGSQFDSKMAHIYEGSPNLEDNGLLSGIISQLSASINEAKQSKLDMGSSKVHWDRFLGALFSTFTDEIKAKAPENDYPGQAIRSFVDSVKTAVSESVTKGKTDWNKVYTNASQLSKTTNFAFDQIEQLRNLVEANLSPSKNPPRRASIASRRASLRSNSASPVKQLGTRNGLLPEGPNFEFGDPLPANLPQIQIETPPLPAPLPAPVPAAVPAASVYTARNANPPNIPHKGPNSNSNPVPFNFELQRPRAQPKFVNRTANPNAYANANASANTYGRANANPMNSRAGVKSLASRANERALKTLQRNKPGSAIKPRVPITGKRTAPAQGLTQRKRLMNSKENK